MTDYIAFVATVLVFLMMPGPGTVAVLASSAKGRSRSGYACLAGLMLGDWLLMLAAMLGVAALLQTHPLIFLALQYLGVGYLLWVGAQLLRAQRHGGDLKSPVTTGTSFRQGFFITLINPKAIVFYMAFFPLFIDPARYQGIVTLLAMGATVSVLTFLYGSLLIGVGHRVAQLLRAHDLVGRWLSRLAGASLIGFGARMATE